MDGRKKKDCWYTGRKERKNGFRLETKWIVGMLKGGRKRETSIGRKEGRKEGRTENIRKERKKERLLVWKEEETEKKSLVC